MHSDRRHTLPTRWFLASAAGGAIAGALYTLSPLGIYGLALVGLAIALAGAGLPSTERQQLTVVLVVAILVRLLVLGAVFVRATPMHDDQFVASYSGDEAYSLARAMRARDAALGVPMNKYDYVVVSDEYGRNGYITLLTGVQLVFGPTPYSMRLVNASIFLAGAILLFRLARHAYGPLPAFTGLVVLLFLPTLFVWSISLLKESLYFAGGAAIVVATASAIRAGRPAIRLAMIAAALAGSLVVRDLRPGALFLAGAGLMTGIAILAITASRRAAVAAFAGATLAAAVIALVPAIGARVMAALESTAKTHTGHVFTVGHAYKLLDAGFYLNPQTPAASTLTLTPDEAVRYVARSLVSFIAVPTPWQLTSWRELTFLPEQLVWYALVALLPAGLIAGWRRDRLVTSLLVGYAIPTAIVLALTNGNVGTLLRLRGLVTPYLVWVSAVGFCAMLQRAERGSW